MWNLLKEGGKCVNWIRNYLYKCTKYSRSFKLASNLNTYIIARKLDYLVKLLFIVNNNSVDCVFCIGLVILLFIIIKEVDVLHFEMNKTWHGTK
jgi:hypothetical protein